MAVMEAVPMDVFDKHLGAWGTSSPSTAAYCDYALKWLGFAKEEAAQMSLDLVFRAMWWRLPGLPRCVFQPFIPCCFLPCCCCCCCWRLLVGGGRMSWCTDHCEDAMSVWYCSGVKHGYQPHVATVPMWFSSPYSYDVHIVDMPIC